MGDVAHFMLPPAAHTPTPAGPHTPQHSSESAGASCVSLPGNPPAFRFPSTPCWPFPVFSLYFHHICMYLQVIHCLVLNSYKWIYTVPSLLWVICNLPTLKLQVVYFYNYVLFSRVTLPQLIYPFHSWPTLAFSIVRYYEQCRSKYLQIYL